MYSLTPIDLFLSFSFLLFISSILYAKLSTKSSATDDTHNKYNDNKPPTYPIIGCLIAFNQNKRRLLEWYTELLAASPTQTIEVSRLGARKTVVTANPENVEYILKTKFNNFPKGQPFAELVGDLLGRGIFNVDGELWASQRKLASHEFTTKSLKEFVVKTLEDEVEGRLFPLLQTAANENKVIDLQEVLKRLTYDTICKVSLGTDPNCLDLSVPVPPLIAAFETAAEISARRSTTPVYLIWKLKRALNLGSEAKLKNSIETIHTQVTKIIQDKQKSFSKTDFNDQSASSHDLLSRFLVAGYDGELARDMVISFLMAGRDTTAAAMTWLFWLISSKNTSTRDSIRAELGTVKSSCQLGYEVVKRDMGYLQACLCETMRLYPPVAWDSKHAANDDVLPDGTRVKKGERVTYFPYGMGRMEKIWGSDWSRFDPDRWFEKAQNDDDDNSRGVLKMVNPYVFPVFQAGPRVCLGKDMAFIQMKYVVASVISRFDFEPVSLEPPVFVPLLTSHMYGGLRVRVKEIGSA
ncbi:cytochrome P450 94B3-like [Silene latifolia]|uniref:cytochrome P450 94B3-like n=1 Tax=Silene latifolia TaxID=37657 RepID=UPI003D771D6B